MGSILEKEKKKQIWNLPSMHPPPSAASGQSPSRCLSSSILIQNISDIRSTLEICPTFLKQIYDMILRQNILLHESLLHIPTLPPASKRLTETRGGLRAAGAALAARAEEGTEGGAGGGRVELVAWKAVWSFGFGRFGFWLVWVWGHLGWVWFGFGHHFCKPGGRLVLQSRHGLEFEAWD